MNVIIVERPLCILHLLRNHIRSHTVLKCSQSKKCGKAFYLVAFLKKKHISTLTKEKPYEYNMPKLSIVHLSLGTYEDPQCKGKR